MIVNKFWNYFIYLFVSISICICVNILGAQLVCYRLVHIVALFFFFSSTYNMTHGLFTRTWLKLIMRHFIDPIHNLQYNFFAIVVVCRRHFIIFYFSSFSFSCHIQRKTKSVINVTVSSLFFLVFFFFFHLELFKLIGLNVNTNFVVKTK